MKSESVNDLMATMHKFVFLIPSRRDLPGGDEKQRLSVSVLSHPPTGRI